MTYNRAATSIVQSTGQVRKAGEHIRLAVAIFRGMTHEEAAARGLDRGWISRLERSLVRLKSIEEELRSAGFGPFMGAEVTIPSEDSPQSR